MSPIPYTLCPGCTETQAWCRPGDLNIAPAPMDNCDPGPPAEFARRADRAWLSGLLASGFRDVFRIFYPDRFGPMRDEDLLEMSPVGCASCRA